MKKKLLSYTTLVIFIFIVVGASYYLFAPPTIGDYEPERNSQRPTTAQTPEEPRGPAKAEDKNASAEEKQPTQVSLAVPYVNEAPDGNWTGPWKNACEEAAIVMVERFYTGQTAVSITDAKAALRRLFAVQDERWGSNANSDAARTAEIANSLGLFKAKVVTKPTLEDIKKELAAKRPVITMHKGFDLGNKNIPFLPTGSSYHVLVLIGYDEVSQEFITHDDGDEKAGKGRRYPYSTVMNSMHDYNYKTNLTDGPARALFTAPQ